LWSRPAHQRPLPAPSPAAFDGDKCLEALLTSCHVGLHLPAEIELKGCLNVIVVLVGLIAIGIAYWLINYPTIHVRYRLTLEVQDGDEIKSGTSVISVTYTIYPDSFVYLGGPSSYRPVVGYSPTVDLGTKGLLFLTFVNADRSPSQRRSRNKLIQCPLDDIACLPFVAYDKPGTGVPIIQSQQKAALYDLLHQSGPRDVPFTILPQLARFADLNDQHSYKSVSPFNLAASFGPGVELKRVVLQLTDDPVTPLPEIWPQWLKESGQMVGTLR
jgi:hypothetical protein